MISSTATDIGGNIDDTGFDFVLQKWSNCKYFAQEPSHPELAEPASLLNEPKAEEELKKEAEQLFRRDSDELEVEELLPVVNIPERQVWIEEWKKEAQQFEIDFSDMEMKIHRFPESLQRIDQRYIFPMVVGIGLYHHNSSNLQEMEKVKRVAAYHFITESGHTFDEMYAAVFSIIGAARRFYNAGDVGDAEFAEIMFIDGCFLLQYMLSYTNRHNHKLPPSLVSCFSSKVSCINNDIMLLENQLPWLVVNTLRRFSFVPVEEFIHVMGLRLQIRGDMDMESAFMDGSYMPPHLLGILWFYTTGGRNNSRMPMYNSGFSKSMSKVISAIELAEIGIKLTASKTTKFMDMGVKKGFLSSEIFLPPILLDDIRSCWLVNMAAFELSLGISTSTDGTKVVVCSYIALLAMLMDREEDVHELRSKRLVQGELTNKETLELVKMVVKTIIVGPLYLHIMQEVEAYKRNRWMWIKVHRFVYKNFKAIVTVFSILGVLVGIFKTLLSLKQQ
ncbi:hypothetical protein ACQ4PT_004059 [Festuca glaucescens]